MLTNQQENFIYPIATFVAGVDEVGRGPLCGDVVTAAVILDRCKAIKGLTDSKKLTETRRLYYYEKIIDNALSWSIGRASVEEIDALNIFHATFLAMQRAVDKLSIKPDHILVDGNRSPVFNAPSTPIVKGDLFVSEISAASILAKVTRDKEMEDLDKLYPNYGLAKHKGYPTRAHLEAIKQYGVNKLYRRSFAPVKALLDSTKLK